MALLTGSAFGLEIQLAPRTLVLSSGGDQLTIHTDFNYSKVSSVTLDIGRNLGVGVRTWEDDCGNLVVRCRKDAVRVAVGDFKSRFTTVKVTLTVNDSAEDSKFLRVRK